MKKINKYLHLVPLVMVLSTLLSHFVDFNYTIVGNILGYSILTNIVGFAYFQINRSRHCFFSRNVWLGLIVINIINILGDSMPYSEYSVLFEITICGVCLLFLIVDRLRWL